MIFYIIIMQMGCIMKVLYTAFNGKCNSSKILLDYIDSNDKLYLKNSFDNSVKDFINKIKNNDYDLVISFGQAPIEKDMIKIESKANNMEDFYETNYDYSKLLNNIENKYNAVLSNDAGNYLCNNLYYYGLKYIYENNLKTKMIFIHIPKINNISDIRLMADLFIVR